MLYLLRKTSLEQLYSLYLKLRKWYLSLTQEELESLKETEPDLIASIQFLIQVVEGEENG